MTREEFKLGKVFTHREKGHFYKVKEVLISKHPDTGIWYDAVLYMNEEGRSFVRSLESFLDNFELGSP